MDAVHKKSFVYKRNRRAGWLCGFLLLGFFLLPFLKGVSFAEEGGASVAASSATAVAPNQELVNRKLEEIKKTQDDIAKYQADSKAKRMEGNTLENEIEIFDDNISQNQLEIRETKLNIEKAEIEMEGSQNQIEEDRVKIEKNKEALKSFLQELYVHQDDSFLEILVTKENISDFFNEINALEAAQDKVLSAVVALKQEREALDKRTKELEETQQTYEGLISMRYEQNAALENLKAQKNEILEATNGEEEKYRALVAENRSLLPSLRAELRDLQSLGQNIQFDDAISAAKYVGEATGVRPAFLLGVLRVESGSGTNIGGGTYSVDMNPSQRPTFETIAQELGYDPNAMPVSKKPKNYSGWGGAMGPAQMMPTTWMSYRGQVSALTGHTPADPWNLTDAIAAMAIKLSQVNGVSSADYNAEYEAAGRYLAGNNWQRFTFYPDKVMYYADLYEKELNGG